MDSNKTEPEDQNSETLEAVETTGQAAADSTNADGSTVDTTGGKSAASPGAARAQKPKGLRRLTARVSIYLLLMIGLLIIAVLVVVATYLTSKNTQPIASIPSQNLSESTLAQLANGGIAVGSAGEILNVQSSAVFANKVLLRQDLEVAGNLQIGKALSLNDLNVAGTAQFSQIQASKDLSVAGNTAIQGTATIGKSLQVSGPGNFSGAVTAPQVTTSGLQLDGDLVITHHITVGGATPARTNGPALGGGGTSSVSGGDTSGSITINTGSGPAAGCLITLNFAARFSATPHVLITPVGAAAGGSSYYVNRSATSFSVCVATPAPANTTFGFDYWVVN
jgi:hypothetical protein